MPFFVEPPRQRKEARLQLFKLSGNAPSLTNILGDCASPTAVILNGPAAGAAVFTKDGGKTGITCLQINVGALGTGISRAQFSVADMDRISAGSTHVTMSLNASSTL